MSGFYTQRVDLPADFSRPRAYKNQLEKWRYEKYKKESLRRAGRSSFHAQCSDETGVETIIMAPMLVQRHVFPLFLLFINGMQTVGKT